MHIDDLPIPEPCCESWSDMEGDFVRRHCNVCDKDVVNLSQMTEEEARDFLENTARPCIRYVCSNNGRVVFLHRQVKRQRRGLKRLLGAALVVPLFLTTACGEEPGDVETEAVAVEPIDETEAPIVNASGTAHLAVDDVLSDSEPDDDTDDVDGAEESPHDGEDVEPIREIQLIGEYVHPDFK